MTKGFVNRRVFSIVVLLVIVCGSAAFSMGAVPQAAPAEPSAAAFPIWSMAPFVLMLASIAVLPMAVPHWWDSNRNKAILSAAMSLPVLVVTLQHDPRLLFHSLLDYASFLT